ncbi:uncharacterized protein LOC118471043 [Xyrichtys novacula]|uniref:Uncharacterized protein LOC118471043 n=1 Tax=Xyrichtys novacula TaxID=13765 RepID=A0AAV1EU04_XYRNO|nr:uncharacterized protein LOC118471043 [Xyrichtys novacula]
MAQTLWRGATNAVLIAAGRSLPRGWPLSLSRLDARSLSRLDAFSPSRSPSSLGADADPGTSGAGAELLTVMRTFLEGQQRREEGLLAELRGLRAALPVPLQQPEAERRPVTPSPAPRTTPPSAGSTMSLRLELPTPAPRPRRSSPVEAPRIGASQSGDCNRPRAGKGP